MEFWAHFLRLFLTHCSPAQISEDLRSYMSVQYPARVWDHRYFMSGHLFWWVGDPFWEEDVKSLLLWQFSFLLSALCCMSCVSLALVTNKVWTLSFSCNRNTTVGIIHGSLKISYFNLVIQQMRKVKLTKQEVVPRLTGLSPWSRTQVFWPLIPFLYIPSSSSQLLPRAGVPEKLRNR